MKHVEIYTDGACSGNPGPGGWAAILRHQGREKELAGGERQTTNNRMELTAALEGLRALKEPCEVALTTDSQYLRLGITEWVPQWQERGWRRRDGKPVKNEDLWRDIAAAAEPHRIEWLWVAGHAGHVENERCDQLAREWVERMKMRE